MERRITVLEVEVKELKAKATDLEFRLRKVERNIHVWSGAIMALQLILKFFVH